MKYDDYGEVINHPETFKWIANDLREGRDNVLIGWTDGHMSHFDILFVDGAKKYGTMQGGVKGSDLFVSIMRVGAFGFEVNQEDTHFNYYDEKLSGMQMGSTTASALAELINGVKKELATWPNPEM